MNRKLFLPAVLLMALLAFSGCTENKKETMQDYSIELIFSDFNFEKQELNFGVFSEKELLKTRIEVIGKEKLQCFDYIDLIKGKNSFQIKCQIDEKNLEVKITPSKGKTKLFGIEIQTKEKITLKKGFRYLFKQRFESKDYNLNITYNFFVLDENTEFTKIMAYSTVDYTVKGNYSEKENTFNLLLIDKDLFEVYSSKPKENCYEAYEAVLERRFEDKEFDLLLPLMFMYLQNNKSFNLKEFLEKKFYSDENSEGLILEINPTKKLVNGREALKIKVTSKKYGEHGYFYLQTEAPFITVYYKRLMEEFEFKEETKEEFDKKKYSCQVIE